jgi:hypothetical protein
MEQDFRALEVLAGIMRRDDPPAWRHGTWLTHNLSAAEQTALDALNPRIGYPAGCHAALYLTGWEERSFWGYDAPAGCYFASLWRNRPPEQDEDDADDPDIWIKGWDALNGQPFNLTTTHMLAREIAAATGHTLESVCAALASSDIH